MDERSAKLKARCKLSEDSSAEGRLLQAAHQLQDKTKKKTNTDLFAEAKSRILSFLIFLDEK